MIAPAADPAGDSESQFAKTRKLLSDLIQLPRLQSIFDEEECLNARKVYTQAPTLWLLTLQRLSGGLSLEQSVSQLINHHSDILPDNRRVREGTLSENNSAYNKARQRLPIEVVEEFSHRVCDHLAARSQRVFEERRVFILDGTTITLPPTEELTEAFPPASNQCGESVWPVAMLMVASELETGCVLLPQVDPMYGENNSSEPQQAEQIIDRLPNHSIVLADSGFGIFRVAWDCQTRGKKFLLRLTNQRFGALKKNATLIDEGKGFRSYHLIWKPSAKECRKNSHFDAAASVEVFVHEVDLADGKQLYLVSNLETDGHSVSELYLRRYDVEFDIRDLKVTMDTENLRAKSVDTMLKELMGSVLAYNLVTQVRKQAAALAQIKPRELSFQGVWTTFQDRLLKKELTSLAQWQVAYAEALVSASKRKLPKRRQPRSYPRVAHPRRPKSTKFQKSLRKRKRNDSPPPD